MIPSVEELKKIKYCKWHNATSHNTIECKVFRQQLQSAIESGRIKFDSSKTQKPMKIDQHPFPMNMLDTKGKTKVLTSETDERNASVDPQHQVATDDAKGKGLIREDSSSGWPPRSSVVITHRHVRKRGSSGGIDIGVSKKIDVKRKKGVDRSGIGIKIIGISRSSFTAGNEISNCRQFGIVPSVVVIVGMIDQIRDSRTMIDVLMSRSGEGHQFTIGWGAGVGSHYRPIINCQLDPKGQEAIILYTHMHFITNKFHLYHSDYILQEL